MGRVCMWILCCCLSGQPLCAQARLQPLIKRIALLQVYLGYVKKGYQVVQTGLRLVGDVKDGEFSLHKTYLHSWAKVNPAIRQGALALSCIQTQQQLIRTCFILGREARAAPMLADREAVARTVALVLLDVERATAIVAEWIEGGAVEAKDADRLSTLDQVHAQMTELNRFIQAYYSEWQILRLQRQRESQSLQTIRAYHKND